MVGLLDQFEHRLDELLNGALTAAFEDEVQPVEIVAAITREMDEHLQELTNGRLVAPNHFIVDLASHDYDRMKDHLKTLEPEFVALATTHAQNQNYSLTGDVVVSVMKDRELDVGVFRISFEQVAATTSSTLPSADIETHSIFIRGVGHPLTKPINRIGRSSDADIVINDPAISRLHAEITIGSEVVLRDLNSTNGTWFNGERISEIVLTESCTFKLGTIEVEFK
jgi:hypothetical protein